MIDEIINKFHSRTNKNRAYIVGIDGLSGAGKTTLVNQLKFEKEYDITIIHIDNHIVEKDKRYNTGVEEWYEYYYLQWDIEMLTENLFKQIHDGNLELILPFYDGITDTINNRVLSITKNSIVLIEGIFLLRKEWEKFYDYTVFVDCPEKIRYSRALNRDSYIGDWQVRLEKYERRYWIAEKYYLELENPIEKVDRVYISTM